MGGNFTASYQKKKGIGVKIYFPVIESVGIKRRGHRYFKTATHALNYAQRWANRLRKEST